MSYVLVLQPIAERHLAEWRKSGQKKIVALFEELQEHSTTGMGQVEQLKGELAGFWSRRIDKCSRMIYSIHDDEVIVSVVSLKGHYGDK